MAFWGLRKEGGGDPTGDSAPLCWDRPADAKGTGAVVSFRRWGHREWGTGRGTPQGGASGQLSCLGGW